jgi:hypothetical protein
MYVKERVSENEDWTNVTAATSGGPSSIGLIRLQLGDQAAYRLELD